MKGSFESEIDQNHEFFYNLVSEVAANILLSNEKKQKFENTLSFGEKKWEISPSKESNFLFGKIFSLTYTYGEDSTIRTEIHRSQSLHSNTLGISLNLVSAKEVIADENRYNATTLKKFNLKKAQENNQIDCQNDPKMVLCNPKELTEGIRGKYRLGESTLKEKVETSFFSSPFAALSRIAFQRYEWEFSGHDHFKPEDCRYCLVVEEGLLKLVQSSKTVKEKKELHRETIESYRQLLHSEYGEEKIAVACKLCRIDFDQMLERREPLTPEHVYRLHLAVNHIEAKDIQKLLCKLPDFKKAFLVAWDSLGEKASLWEILKQMKSCPLTLREVRGIFHLLNDHPKKWIEWLDLFAEKNQVQELSPHLLDQLVQVLLPTAEEYPKIFTGREIQVSIKTCYTLADRNELKPWVDLQEFLHVFPLLQGMKDWDVYCEKSSHTICKKHLFHPHPIKGFTTGTLVPAPLGENGQSRWYKVSQAIHNGYGMLCYLLEPVCDDPSLPLLFLYRSTASDNYAVFGSKTVRTDMNPLGLPGYEGKEKADLYEKPKFFSSTIPLWVGYLIAAKTKLSLLKQADEKGVKSLFKTLIACTDELYLYEDAKVPLLPLKEILIKHSGIINTLFLKGYLSLPFYEQLRKEYFFKDDKHRVSEKKDAVARKEQVKSDPLKEPWLKHPLNLSLL